MLVGAGTNWPSGTTNDVEVVDLDSSGTTCNRLPVLPFVVNGHFGGLGWADQPLICGGLNSTFLKNCSSLEGNEWIPAPDMNEERAYAAVSKSPFPNGPHKLLVTGGRNSGGDLQTSEMLTEKGWEYILPPLPVTIYDHCTVLVNSTTILMIGGSQRL